METTEMNTAKQKDDVQNIYDHTELYRCEIEEINLKKQSKCEKNDGHKDFIPADEFTILDLPDTYREQKIFDFIQIASVLTARIAVAKTSEFRPEVFPGTSNPYTCYEDRGKEVLHFGTGKITDVCKLKTPKTCQCSNCITKDKPNNVCGEIWISTAAHVVYDKLEAENTTCRLFFDKENCKKVIVQGVDVVDVNIRKDCCTLICETCDENLILMLTYTLKDFENLERLIYKTVKKPIPEEKMFVIISHPHGTPKHISIGRRYVTNKHENIFSQQFYNTPTCPGSSGAPVLIFGFIGWYSGIVHSGTNWTLNSNSIVWNYSTLGFDFLFTPSLSENITETMASESTAIGTSRELYRIPSENVHSKKDNALCDCIGIDKQRQHIPQEIDSKQNDHDDTEKPINERTLLHLSPQKVGNNFKDKENSTTVNVREDFFEGREIDLHQHYRKCKKNPRHPEFIPVESFYISHLPEGYQDENIYELIKGLSDLTVRVSVTMTSPDRPEFWPGTKIPYHLSDMKGKKTMRTGTGFIYDMIKYTDGYKCCQCDKCQASEAPSKIWFEIIIFTAAHVVFDDIEAAHTTVRLFYDRKDSPLVILRDKQKTIKVFIEEDTCVFKIITCDKYLADKLKKNIEHVKPLKTEVYRKYYKKFEEGSLLFIVAHPHGCSKQVSVGKCKDVNAVGKLREKFTYTTCTCPGSSGALVFNINCKVINLHSGSLNSGINYGNVGFTE